MIYPAFSASDPLLEQAYRIAMGDLIGNIIPFQDGLLTSAKPAIMAGLDYNTPWTRDAAINTWNAGGLLFPEIARSTLESVLESKDEKVVIGGQYWDAIIWTTGAWSYYLFSGDREFLKLALEATRNSLDAFEKAEFTPELNLFRGAACYGDGVSAYPDAYTNHGSSGILEWVKANPQHASKQGFGIPMHALSTNCLYYNAYVLADKMAAELGVPARSSDAAKAKNLKNAINRHFWLPGKGHYRYLVDRFDNCEHQEGLGHAFALLFGVADRDQALATLLSQHITAAGIPCVWPTFKRYARIGDHAFGRHSGTVWPHVQGFWASAALAFGESGHFEYELHQLAAHACRDSQFTEIYHPQRGDIYGGMQESEEAGVRLWSSCRRQTWSATAYLRMVLTGLFGLDFKTDGVSINPTLPATCKEISLKGLPYRSMNLDLAITGSGTKITGVTINGKRTEKAFLPANGSGEFKIKIEMA